MLRPAIAPKFLYTARQIVVRIYCPWGARVMVWAFDFAWSHCRTSHQVLSGWSLVLQLMFSSTNLYKYLAKEAHATVQAKSVRVRGSVRCLCVRLFCSLVQWVQSWEQWPDAWSFINERGKLLILVFFFFCFCVLTGTWDCGPCRIWFLNCKERNFTPCERLVDNLAGFATTLFNYLHNIYFTPTLC